MTPTNGFTQADGARMLTEINVKIRTNNIKMRSTLETIMKDSEAALAEIDKWDADSLVRGAEIVRKIRNDAGKWFDREPAKPEAVAARCRHCTRLYAIIHLKDGFCPKCTVEPKPPTG